mmetsp:Transcript_66719/g.206336  ORF Transcript_66719/g.206336 Transcript_66719/m.206336 type:complete len:216 (+) Transcript_66719:558-1205(+)
MARPIANSALTATLRSSRCRATSSLHTAQGWNSRRSISAAAVSAALSASLCSPAAVAGSSSRGSARRHRSSCTKRTFAHESSRPASCATEASPGASAMRFARASKNSSSSSSLSAYLCAMSTICSALNDDGASWTLLAIMKSQNSSMGRAVEVRATTKVVISSGVSSGTRSQTKLETSWTSLAPKGRSPSAMILRAWPPLSSVDNWLHCPKIQAI